MATSKAFRDFLDALGLVDELLRVEASYDDPAPEGDQRIVGGLRGGASVLMVAAFENYLKELIEENFDDLAYMPLRFDPSLVPDEMFFSHLDFMVSSTAKLAREGKVAKINEMAATIVSGVIMPNSFTSAVRSNPNASKLKEMFKRMGIKDCYALLKKDFDKEWGEVEADTFISGYLDSILDRRHKVAHTANTLAIARRDLHESLRFLKALGKVCDSHIALHIDGMRKKESS